MTHEASMFLRPEGVIVAKVQHRHLQIIDDCQWSPLIVTEVVDPQLITSCVKKASEHRETP